MKCMLIVLSCPLKSHCSSSQVQTTIVINKIWCCSVHMYGPTKFGAAAPQLCRQNTELGSHFKGWVQQSPTHCWARGPDSPAPCCWLACHVALPFTTNWPSQPIRVGALIALWTGRPPFPAPVGCCSTLKTSCVLWEASIFFSGSPSSTLTSWILWALPDFAKSEKSQYWWSLSIGPCQELVLCRSMCCLLK